VEEEKKIPVHRVASKSLSPHQPIDSIEEGIGSRKNKCPGTSGSKNQGRREGLRRWTSDCKGEEYDSNTLNLLIC